MGMRGLAVGYITALTFDYRRLSRRRRQHDTLSSYMYTRRRDDFHCATAWALMRDTYAHGRPMDSEAQLVNVLPTAGPDSKAMRGFAR